MILIIVKKILVAAVLAVGLVTHSAAEVIFNWVPTSQGNPGAYNGRITVADSIYVQAQSAPIDFFGFTARRGLERPGVGNGSLNVLTPDVSVQTRLYRTFYGPPESVSTADAVALCPIVNDCRFDSITSSVATYSGLAASDFLSVVLDGAYSSGLFRLSNNILAVQISIANIDGDFFRIGSTSWEATGSGRGTGFWQIDPRSIPINGSVPAPATLVLLVFGLGGMALRKLRP